MASLVGQIETDKIKNAPVLYLWPLNWSFSYVGLAPLATLWFPEFGYVRNTSMFFKGMECKIKNGNRIWTAQNWKCDTMSSEMAARHLDPPKRLGAVRPGGVPPGPAQEERPRGIAVRLSYHPVTSAGGSVDTTRKIEYAKWVLERNIGWIAQAEVKVAAVITLNIALISSLAVAYTMVSSRSHWAIGFSCSSGFLLLVGMGYAAKALFPNTKNDKPSFVFFAKIISDRDSYLFDKAFQAATEAEVLADLTDQVFRNATIANDKHFAVKRAMAFTLLGGCVWIPAVLCLIKH